VDITERELIDRALRGDQGAMQALYERHASALLGVIQRMEADVMAAEDLAQDAWVRAFQGLASFRGDSSFLTWLTRIACNTTFSRRRRWERLPRAELPDEPAVASHEEQVLLRIPLERALRQLPRSMRAVIVLHDIHGHTHEEIAAILGMAVGTSRSTLFRARARMHLVLNGDLRKDSGGIT
jgi:RNA polymerase sigma-70 factor (ECF subfamily)